MNPLDKFREQAERLIGWAKSGKNSTDYTMDIENVDQMAAALATAAEAYGRELVEHELKGVKEQLWQKWRLELVVWDYSDLEAAFDAAIAAYQDPKTINNDKE